jgi:hypothetical protein
MRVSLPRLPVVHLRRRGSVVAVLVVAAVLLELAAGAGLAYVAGWSKVRAVLGGADWVWLVVLVGVLLISFAGYYYADQGISRVEGGPAVPGRQMRAVGFGGFSPVAAVRWISTRCGRPVPVSRGPRSGWLAWLAWLAWSTACWRSAAAQRRSRCWPAGAVPAAGFHPARGGAADPTGRTGRARRT